MTVIDAEEKDQPRALSAKTSLKLEKIILEPRSSWQPIQFRELWRYRDLLWQLSLREIQVRYKQTILGVFWAVIQPLLTTGIFAALMGTLMGRGHEPGIKGIPYVVSTFCAMLPWQLFANSLTQAGNSLVANQRLITKVYFPRLIIPLSAVLGALADFMIGLVALFCIMFWYGIVPGWTVITLPFFILLSIVTSLSVGLWLCALTAIYRDFRYIVPFLVQLGMFISPVIYTSQSLVEKLSTYPRRLYGLNPMVGAIEGFRWALLGAAPPGWTIVPSLVVTGILLIAGAYYFRHMERTFADVI